MEANDITRLAKAQPEGRALDQAFYHDEAIYRKELERIFMRAWLYAGHISEIHGTENEFIPIGSQLDIQPVIDIRPIPCF